MWDICSGHPWHDSWQDAGRWTWKVIRCLCKPYCSSCQWMLQAHVCLQATCGTASVAAHELHAARTYTASC